MMVESISKVSSARRDIHVCPDEKEHLPVRLQDFLAYFSGVDMAEERLYTALMAVPRRPVASFSTGMY